MTFQSTKDRLIFILEKKKRRLLQYFLSFVEWNTLVQRINCKNLFSLWKHFFSILNLYFLSLKTLETCKMLNLFTSKRRGPYKIGLMLRVNQILTVKDRRWREKKKRSKVETFKIENENEVHITFCGSTPALPPPFHLVLKWTWPWTWVSRLNFDVGPIGQEMFVV